MNTFTITFNSNVGKDRPELADAFDMANALTVNAFHKTFDEYQITPLVSLADTAKLLGAGDIFVKDESPRFGLNAFKGLGGSYCMGKYIAGLLGEEMSNMSCQKITDKSTKDAVGNITFVTATDGNHGRGVAWTASRLGFDAAVYMPAGSAAERLENIRKTGAKAEMTDVNYDNTVRFARKQAEENGWVLVQDTAWEGYETIPTYIMQGYLTMAYEAMQQLGDKVPTHIFLQAGVGSMPGALTAFFRNVYGFASKIVIVEPNKANCIYKTAAANDSKLHYVTGNMNTIMAGLACGEPCTIAWDLLSYGADAFISMPDRCAAAGMRILGNPAGSDTKIVSGESGASTFGAVVEILRNQPQVKQDLSIDDQSVILCFSTEGATDVQNYRKIVWDGANYDCEEQTND